MGGITDGPLRIKFAGALYHITAGGVHDGLAIIEEADRKMFRELLGKVVHTIKREIGDYISVVRMIVSRAVKKAET